MYRRALSTIASGQGKPYLSIRSFSRLPELTPIRIGMPLSRALRTTSLNRSSPPMLPGLIRILSTAGRPEGVAASRQASAIR